MEQSRKPLLWGAVLLLAFGLLAFGKILTYDFAAWDTFPLIAAGRVGEGAALGDVLLTPLMGSYFPYGQYYRPTVHLSFALDHAIWGLEPFGYHLTDLLLHLLNAVLVLGLIRLLLPGVRAPAAVAAAMVLLLHPSVVAVVPVIPRRIDLLAAAFMLGSLLCLLRPVQKPATLALALLLGLFALGSKESALCLPVLHGAWVWLGSSERDLARRFRKALEASWPLWILAAGFFVARWGVLGGLGGVASDASAPPWLVRVPVMLAGFLGNLLFPLPNRQGLGPGGLLIPGALLVLAYAVSRVRIWSRKPERRRVVHFALLWLGLLLGLQLPLGATPLRLAYLALVPFSLLMAAALDDLLDAFAARGGGEVRERRERVWGAIPALLWLSFLALSPLVHSYAHPWRDAGRTTRRALELIDPHLASRSSGGTVALSQLPSTVLYDPERFRIAIPFTTILAAYSIRAWIDLRYPGSNLEITVRSPVSLPEPVDPKGIALVPDGDSLRFEYPRRP
jgi:hypothetical protein